MFGLGFGELVVILLIVVILFGVGKLPQLGEGLGKAIRGFRKGVAAPADDDAPAPRTGSPPDGKP